jgi:hypothetical protein
MNSLNFPENTQNIDQEPKTEEEISKVSLSAEQEKELAKSIFEIIEKHDVEDIFKILNMVKIIALNRMIIQQQYEKKDEFRKERRNNAGLTRLKRYSQYL